MKLEKMKGGRLFLSIGLMAVIFLQPSLSLAANNQPFGTRDMQSKISLDNAYLLP